MMLVKMIAAVLLLLFLWLIATVLQEILGAEGARVAVVAIGALIIVLLLALGIAKAK